MIIISRAAKEVDFCGNELRFRVKSTKAYETNGSAAELVLNVNSNASTGNIFTFTFGNKTVRFTTSSTLDDSGTVILNGSGIIQIVDVFQKNFLLQKFFKISYSGNKIYLRAKETGSFYSLTFWSNSGNISLFQNTPGTDKVMRNGYKTLCETYIETDRLSNQFDLVSIMLHNADANGECDVKPGKLLQKYFDDISLPDYGQSTIKKAEKAAKRYYLKLAEMYEGEVRQVLTSSVLYAVDGTINKDLYSDNFNYLDNIAGFKSYLLHPDVNKIETWRNAQQFLYYIGNLSSYTITQKVKIYYTDGSNETVTKNTQTGALKAECYIIPSGFEQLNLAAVTPAKEAYKYEVYLENNGVQIGKTITYYLVPKPVNGREFWFKNSMGGMEVVLCEKQTHKLDVKRNELKCETTYNTDIDEINDSYECITGNKTMPEIEHLAEFVNTRKAYLIQKGNIYEVAIEAGTYTLADENEDLYSFKFKYRVKGKNKAENGTQIVISAGGYVLGVNTAVKKIIVGYNSN